MTNTAAAHDTAQGEGSRTRGAGRGFAWLLVITAAAGLLASWVITIDKYKLLEDPDFVPGCSLNPVVSCGSVMQSEQASVFGFPNPMAGLVAYGVVIAIGVGVLAGARYRRWYWLGLNAGMFLGVVFCTWLMIQALYEINALCLWCVLAWIATLVMFWYTTSYNIRNGVIPAPGALRSFFDEFTWVLPALHIGVIGMLILTRWWDFWTS
ncbi:integral membrane protein [Streptomyces laurentii]|uniref:Integral membrane protein n=1 Tax=Streptomyces laurentii TaxID=39478 RepID=A0A160NVM0_STRLU|nr:integral membrane protein [Streptomyces laurentii]